MSQIESKERDILEVKSALNISDLIQFMKDECNSLEEEKRFLITQCITLIVAIIILFWAMVELLINQMSFEFDITGDDIFGMKVVYASLILAISFQIYRMISLLYVNKLHRDILRFINAPSEDVNYIHFFPGLLIFIILLFHRFCPWIQSFPFEILKTSIYSSFLLFVIGLEIAIVLLSVVLMKKYSGKLERPQFKMKTSDISSKKELDFFLVIGMIYQFSILLVFIWILENLEKLPIELLGIQLKFGLISIAIFFSYVYLAKPLRNRLKELVMKIELFNKLIAEAVSGKITADEIVSKMYQNIKS